MSKYKYKWRVSGSIKAFGLCGLIFTLLLPISLCIVFILSRLLKLIPEPTFPEINIPGMTDKIAKLEEGVPLAIQIRMSILFIMFFLTLVNCVANFRKIKLFDDSIKQIKTENSSNAKRKKNIYIFGAFFCFFCCLLVFADFLVTILKITDIIKNQHFYNILLSCSIFYALMPLLDLVMFIFRESIKCFCYDIISEKEESWQAKIYSRLSNIDHVTSIFCFVFDLMDWKEIKENRNNECLSADYIIQHNSSNSINQCSLNLKLNEPEKYTFLLFYCMPIEVSKIEI